MNKFNNYFGAIGGLLLLVGVFFKSLHYPGANILIMVGGVFGILYFLLSLFYKESSSPSPCALFAEYFVSLTMLVYLSSFVFKVMQLSGADVLVSISTWMFTISSLALIMSIIMNKDKQFISLNKVVFVIIYLIPVLVFVSKPF